MLIRTHLQQNHQKIQSIIKSKCMGFSVWTPVFPWISKGSHWHPPAARKLVAFSQLRNRSRFMRMSCRGVALENDAWNIGSVQAKICKKPGFLPSKKWWVGSIAVRLVTEHYLLFGLLGGFVQKQCLPSLPSLGERRPSRKWIYVYNA